MLDNLLKPGPSFVSIKYSTGDPTLTIEVDTKNYAQPGTLKLILRGSLVNYPDAVFLDKAIVLVVEESNTFVFVWP